MTVVVIENATVDLSYAVPRLPASSMLGHAAVVLLQSRQHTREPSSEETEAALFGSPAAYLARAVASDYTHLLRRPLLEHRDGLLVHFLFAPDTASVYG